MLGGIYDAVVAEHDGERIVAARKERLCQFVFLGDLSAFFLGEGPLPDPLVGFVAGLWGGDALREAVGLEMDLWVDSDGICSDCGEGRGSWWE